ncbi:hypothetical protein PT974_09873 [Cladobotryum mycophilum]|uniref:Uncharacterized protein n=1 Tax=Cladobotryum mycophilum TaxID=491253 RepID=A0ABR0SHF0_9HYPO
MSLTTGASDLALTIDELRLRISDYATMEQRIQTSAETGKSSTPHDQVEEVATRPLEG